MQFRNITLRQRTYKLQWYRYLRCNLVKMPGKCIVIGSCILLLTALVVLTSSLGNWRYSQFNNQHFSTLTLQAVKCISREISGPSSLRTQTYFRLSLLSFFGGEKRPPEIRLRSQAKDLHLVPLYRQHQAIKTPV